MFGHLLKRGAAMLCLAAVLALPVCAEGRITTDMTMKEIRSDPAIAGSCAGCSVRISAMATRSMMCQSPVHC